MRPFYSPRNATATMLRQAGRLILEATFWLAGIALTVASLGTITSLEYQRIRGIDVFSQARAASEPLTDTGSLPIALLRIARVGVEVPVYADAGDLNLSRGAGWIAGTAAPGSAGNMAIAAHRDRYFRPLKDIRVGDILELESLSGRGQFRVSRITIVDPGDVSVLDDTVAPTVTLVTCYPFYFIGNAPQRFIVQATAIDQTGEQPDPGLLPIVKETGDSS